MLASILWSYAYHDRQPLVTLLTRQAVPIRFDYAYAEQARRWRPVVDSTFTLALVAWPGVAYVPQKVSANFGRYKILLLPLFGQRVPRRRASRGEARDFQVV